MVASDAFEEGFVRHQEGVLRRILVRDGEDGFADVVFFEDDAAIRRMVEVEQNRNVCAALFSIMDGEDQHRVYEVIKTYEPVKAATP